MPEYLRVRRRPAVESVLWGARGNRYGKYGLRQPGRYLTRSIIDIRTPTEFEVVTFVAFSRAENWAKTIRTDCRPN